MCAVNIIAKSKNKPVFHLWGQLHFTSERGVSQFTEASIVEVLNPPWHIAALVVLDNSTVTMAGIR